MIDLQRETIVSLSEATRHLPPRRRGKRPAVATLYRWASRGLRGVRLETIRVGGTLCTSLEALQRYCERLSDPLDNAAQGVRRNSNDENAERSLEADGW